VENKNYKIVMMLLFFALLGGCATNAIINDNNRNTQDKSNQHSSIVITKSPITKKEYDKLSIFGLAPTSGTVIKNGKAQLYILGDGRLRNCFTGIPYETFICRMIGPLEVALQSRKFPSVRFELDLGENAICYTGGIGNICDTVSASSQIATISIDNSREQCAIEYNNSAFCEKSNPFQNIPFDNPTLSFDNKDYQLSAISDRNNSYSCVDWTIGHICEVNGPNKVRINLNNKIMYYLLKDKEQSLCYLSSRILFCDVFSLENEK